jgi:hypothetical protein
MEGEYIGDMVLGFICAPWRGGVRALDVGWTALIRSVEWVIGLAGFLGQGLPVFGQLSDLCR